MEGRKTMKEKVKIDKKNTGVIYNGYIIATTGQVVEDRTHYIDQQDQFANISPLYILCKDQFKKMATQHTQLGSSPPCY